MTATFVATRTDLPIGDEPVAKIEGFDQDISDAVRRGHITLRHAERAQAKRNAA